MQMCENVFFFVRSFELKSAQLARQHLKLRARGFQQKKKQYILYINIEIIILGKYYGVVVYVCVYLYINE